MKMNKKDYVVAFLAGMVTVVFSWPTLKNIQIAGGVLVYALFIAVPVCWVLGIWLGRFLSRFLGFMQQFAKFVVVGFLNTSIDFGVLNLLSLFTGLTSGLVLGGVNVPGFILAAVNSYFWNKFWVFKKSEDAGPASAEATAGKKKTDYSDLGTFFLVILLGAIINGGLVVVLTTYVSPLAGTSPERWLNISKACATVLSLVWNFIGFKFLVFKAKDQAIS